MIFAQPRIAGVTPHQGSEKPQHVVPLASRLNESEASEQKCAFGGLCEDTFTIVTGPTVNRSIAVRDTLKKAENATVGMAKLLNFHGLESAAWNFSVSP